MSFTDLISSLDDKTNSARASNCYVTLGGLPERTRYFRCRVLHFYINQGSLDNTWAGVRHFIQLTSDNFILSGGRSGNKSLQTISTILNNNTALINGEVFTIQNFNGKVINFKLVDEYEASLDLLVNQNSLNTVWHLALELTPIDDLC